MYMSRIEMGGTDDDSKRRNVLVGIRFDGHTKELLDWALVKVADPGDRVLAIHVSTKSSSASGSDDPNAKESSSSSSSLESYLDDYDGLCTKNQVHLKAEVLKGSSTRKVLVREAKKHDAVAVIVGTSNHKRPLGLGGWASIAKYCAKQLPTSVEVMAIHNGRIVFRRGSNSQYTGAAGDPRPSFYTERSSTVGDSQSEFGESVISEMGRLSHEERCTVCCENYSQDGRLSSTSPKGTHKKGCLSLGSISLPAVDLDMPPGWPLLRYEPPVPVHARKMSVVQWVMTLPNRSLLDLGSSPKSLEEENCSSFADKNESCSELINDFKLLIETNSPGCKWFSYSVLTASTSQFSSENLIGKGGCNRVYKGVLPDGKQVAVKISKSSKKARKDFMQEVDIMTSVKHKNIAPLLGICIEDSSDLVSVYNFLSKGNLEENLHGKGKRKSPLLPWNVRLRIATGIAEALNYLHNEHPRPIIHRDVKSSNILLGDEFEAKLSDFGLAIWGPTRTSFATHTDVVGTFGYLAPEYFMYGKVSDKIDVYSFGVVLLELLSGRRAIGFESARGGQESLVMWAKPKLESGDLKGIIDENLNVNGYEAEVQRVGLAARLCLTQAARFRPNIAQMLKVLRGKKDSKGEEEMENDDELQKVEMDDEVYPDSSIESHLSVALQDSDANHYSSASFSSSSSSSIPYSVEEYSKKRWSRSSSLD